MEWIILSLFSLAIVLLLISFIKKDKVAKLEEELEQVTLTHMQDIFQLKKKVKILEEELLIQDEPNYRSTSIPYQPLSTIQPINEIIKSQVAALYHQGRSLEQIEKQSTLTKEQIIQVIEEQGLRGLEHE
ncbi:hypothetical protein V7068_03830 [Bacillus sp. JJ634]